MQVFAFLFVDYKQCVCSHFLMCITGAKTHHHSHTKNATVQTKTETAKKKKEKEMMLQIIKFFKSNTEDKELNVFGDMQ